ncbi:hypothetical protein HanXRQr2_Chr17g0782231 [Helianthus annuus]|uniref:Uncharacterized protein n=1 Tax=Helianthus annuus TaxID=4232 RepID=A0A9K3GRX8_HELAN|nr:hypothetical protein HanXRQr2_Chr17g0782231 [Helianthus annuus]
MAHTYKNKTDLATIGKEAFDVIDSRGRQYSKQHMSHYQYQPQQAYVVQQQVYAAPVTKRVITCDDAAKMYGGTLFVEYPKRKPARKGFFYM